MGVERRRAEHFGEPRIGVSLLVDTGLAPTAVRPLQCVIFRAFVEPWSVSSPEDA